MRKRKLKCPYVYRHFKGNMYVTLDVSKHVSKQDFHSISRIEYMKVFHTEINKEITIYIDANARLLHDEEYGKELVIYKALYENNGYYACPKDVFMGEIDKEKHPEYIDKYRFMECRREVKHYE